MEFKYFHEKSKTPHSESNVFSSTTNCERFFNLPLDISTPPSRFSKIVNPFECRLLDRLHLPTFSPSVFAVSTPKAEEKFKWTIDDISSLKPADIDEATISQHVFDEDPHIESLAQQKIDEFFRDKVIVPSPMVDVVRVPLITESPVRFILPQEPKDYCETSTQTMLSLPPVLPPHIEEILKPYYQPVEETNMLKDFKNRSLSRNLFRHCTSIASPLENHCVLSPVALSEKEFSPVALSAKLDGRHSPSGSVEFEEPSYLHDCSLSPIGGRNGNRSPKELTSPVTLDFVSKMSMDASFNVPDIGNEMSSTSIVHETSQYYQQPCEELSDSPVNWDMENEHVSLISPNEMDMSNNNTPISKIFTSQRKRLSRSFNIEEDESRKEYETSSENIKQGRKFPRDDFTDPGYHTATINYCDESSIHMFASTPTKSQLIWN